MSGEREGKRFFTLFGMKVRPDPMVPKGYVEVHDENGIRQRVRVAFDTGLGKAEATKEGGS